MTEGVEFYCNYLIKLGVGDPYRLEHIKQHYIQHNSLWSADEKYLEHLKKKYIHNVENPPEKLKTEFPTADKYETTNDSSPKKIHCWKCGAKNDGSAKFCNQCAHPLREVGVEKKLVSKRTIAAASTFGSSKKKIIIITAIAVCIALIGGGAAMYSGNIDFNQSITTTQKQVNPLPITEEQTHSKCGPGTIFDEDTNACILALPTESNADKDTESTEQTNSKCGPGTVFDSKTNTCVLADETNTSSHSKCGPGTEYDPQSNSCVLI